MDVNSLLVSLPIAVALGILTGLGVGGGSLLLLWLTLGDGMDPGEARIISLLFFLPAALLSGVLRRDSISWKALVPGILGGIGAAALGSLLARVLEVRIFQKGLGILLVITGLRELTQKDKK